MAAFTIFLDVAFALEIASRTSCLFAVALERSTLPDSLMSISPAGPVITMAPLPA